MLKVVQWSAIAVLLLLAVPRSRAQCLPAVCGLTISLQSDASGLALGGSGTAAATMSFGTMQAFGGSVPAGVTKSVTATTWTISTPFDVKVGCTNLLTLLPCTLIVTPTFVLTLAAQAQPR